MDNTFRTPSPPPILPLTPDPPSSPLIQAGGSLPRTPGCIEQENSKTALISSTICEDSFDAADPFCDTRNEPQTPTTKITRSNWHGLPSPLTPAINQLCLETDSEISLAKRTDSLIFDNQPSVTFDKQPTLEDPPNATEVLRSSKDEPGLTESPSHHGFARSPSLETDIATPCKSSVNTRSGRQAASEATFVRRSARFTKKSFKAEHTLQARYPKKKEAKAPTTPVLTWTGPSDSPYDVSINQDDNPVPLSTDWQLQYPPGGSTHPSYPWPTSDQRLTFHAHFVPLIDGLPDTSQAPKLSLPLGWRQVSWFGLLPVVFDPYHQAFKLTPVGPMPLTSEELHQGGLYRYTPGGDMHPETDMLPDISLFGDGSNLDIYNFDGVDWILPQCSFQGPALVEGMSEGEVWKADPEASQENGKSGDNVSEVSAYNETCDCPDDIVDLEDAWRWMTQKEQDPESPFEKSPGKTWQGSGITLTQRKKKQPIPCLIAKALASKGENQTAFLVKQNKRGFCPIKSVATPTSVDISLLGDVEFTLMELLCYFPLHSAWSKGAERLNSAGTQATAIANLINKTRGLSSAEGLSRRSISARLFGKKQDTAAPPDDSTPSSSPQSYSAGSWTYEGAEKTDYPLLGLTHGLRELPSGVDAGPLTALITKCRAEGRYETMLSEVPRLLEEAGIESLIDMGNGEPDKEVISRHAKAVAEFRERVESRGNLDGSGDRSRKRKKVE